MDPGRAIFEPDLGHSGDQFWSNCGRLFFPFRTNLSRIWTILGTGFGENWIQFEPDLDHSGVRFWSNSDPFWTRKCTPSGPKSALLLLQKVCFCSRKKCGSVPGKNQFLFPGICSFLGICFSAFLVRRCWSFCPRGVLQMADRASGWRILALLGHCNGFPSSKKVRFCPRKSVFLLQEKHYFGRIRSPKWSKSGSKYGSKLVKTGSKFDQNRPPNWSKSDSKLPRNGSRI